MRYLFFVIISTGLLLSSCSDKLSFNSMTYVPLYFDTLTVQTSGNYTATATLEFKKNVMVTKDQTKNYKQMVFSNRVVPVMIDPSKNNTLRSRFNQMRSKRGNLKASFKLASDPTYDLALYNLVEMYPYVDYWTNIKVNRTVVGRKKLIGRSKGSYYKNGPETVTIYATGIDILSDEQLEEIKRKKEAELRLKNAPKIEEVKPEVKPAPLPETPKPTPSKTKTTKSKG
jgi:hypothetical protein